MTRWRAAVALLLAVFLGVPLLLPLLGWGGTIAVLPLLRRVTDPESWSVWGETGRLLGLARNTALLVASVLVVAMPLGTAGAVLLYRTDLPFRRTLRFLSILTLFVPLPLFTSGWQAVLGAGGWLPLDWWNPARPGAPSLTAPGGSWTPWGQGIGSAVWIHAAVSLPWVVLLVGQGLSWVERELEEDALTVAGRWWVLTRVTLWRCRAALAAAALWVALQTAGEITVTDMMQVRTFAEEVYTQYVLGADSDLNRAVAAAAPLVAVAAVLLVFLAGRWERNLPPRATATAPPLLFSLGRMRWPACVLATAAFALLLAAPLGSLVWRAGLHGAPPTWSGLTTLRELALALRTDGPLLGESLLLAATAGTISAALALAACWAALGARRFRTGVLALMALAWALPGPIVGLGLKATIQGLLDVTGSPRVLAYPLYYGPSMLPLLWIDAIRFFPCAAALLWPVVRLTPPELRDAARVDGASPSREFGLVIWPLHARACLRAALAVAVLSLGELSAGKLVSTPDMPAFAESVFTQMHYGVKPDLAASCLLLLAAVALGAVLLAVTEWYGERRDGKV